MYYQVDEYNITWEGRGKLTEYGKLSHYFLGLRNQYKYSNFIDFSNYNQEEVVVRNTNSERVIESVYYQLFGMYSIDPKITENIDKRIKIDKETFKYSLPPNSDNWKKNLEFKEFYDKILEYPNESKNIVIDLDYIDKKKFNTTLVDADSEYRKTSTCKNHNRYLELIGTKSTYEDIKNEFLDTYLDKLYVFWKAIDKKASYKDASTLADQFICVFEGGKKNEIEIFEKISDISSNYYFEDCKKVTFYSIYSTICHSKTCILNASKKMRQLINTFDAKIENKDLTIKMFIDAGHDITINNFQILMKKAFRYNTKDCVFATNIFFELYKKGNDNYFIRYYENDALALEIDYNEFKSTINKMLWTENEIDSFCKGDEDDIMQTHSEQDIDEF